MNQILFYRLLNLRFLKKNQILIRKILTNFLFIQQKVQYIEKEKTALVSPWLMIKVNHKSNKRKLKRLKGSNHPERQ